MNTALVTACVLACCGCQELYGVSASNAGADAHAGSAADANTGGSADAAAGVPGTFVQLNSNLTGETTNTTLGVALPDAIDAGDLIVVAVSTYETSISSIAGTFDGSAYTPIFTDAATGLGDGDPASQLSMYYAIAPADGDYKLTLELVFHGGDDSGATVAALDYRGAHTLVGQAVNTGTTLDEPASCQPLAPVNSGQLDIAAMVADGMVTVASGSGYSLRAVAEEDDSDDPVLVTEDGTGQAGAAFAISRMDGSGGWVCGVAAFE